MAWKDYSEDIEVEEYYRDFAIDRGYGIEMVRFKARRKSRPGVDIGWLLRGVLVKGAVDGRRNDDNQREGDAGVGADN